MKLTRNELCEFVACRAAQDDVGDARAGPIDLDRACRQLGRAFAHRVCPDGADQPMLICQPQSTRLPGEQFFARRCSPRSKGAVKIAGEISFSAAVTALDSSY